MVTADRRESGCERQRGGRAGRGGPGYSTSGIFIEIALCEGLFRTTRYVAGKASKRGKVTSNKKIHNIQPHPLADGAGVVKRDRKVCTASSARATSAPAHHSAERTGTAGSLSGNPLCTLVPSRHGTWCLWEAVGTARGCPDTAQWVGEHARESSAAVVRYHYLLRPCWPGPPHPPPPCLAPPHTSKGSWCMR